MKGNGECEKCKTKFTWVRSKNQSIPRFCSLKCREHTGFIPGGKFRTSSENKEEKYSRMKRNLERLVIKKDGCWEWQGDIENNGYARLSIRDVPARHAHRASYLLYKGEIPEGLQVNHLCHVRSCCNPEHLYLGSQKENMKDKIDLDRQAKGSKNGNSKLTEKQVKEIKILLEKGLTCAQIGKQYEVSGTTILNIKTLRQWRHIA